MMKVWYIRISVPIVSFLLIIFSCTVPGNKTVPSNKTESKTLTFNWSDSNNTGFLTLDQLNVFMKDKKDFFKEEGGLNSENGKDTVGYFIQKENFLWIILVGYSDVFSVRYLCCKRTQNNKYSIIKSELGAEILGECSFEWENYLQNAGPYMIIEQLSNGSGYCGSFPRIFKLDGTEINSGDLNFTYWGCDENGDDSYCNRSDVEFVFKDDYLQSHHSVDIMREDDRIVRKHLSYDVRYFFDELNLLTKDTVNVKETSFR